MIAGDDRHTLGPDAGERVRLRENFVMRDGAVFGQVAGDHQMVGSMSERVFERSEETRAAKAGVELPKKAEIVEPKSVAQAAQRMVRLEQMNVGEMCDQRHRSNEVHDRCHERVSAARTSGEV